MASVKIILTFAVTASILMLKPCSVTSTIFSPLSSPSLDKICDEVECGEGKCRPSAESPFLFDCECEDGWNQARAEDNDFFKFLPCVIPDCSLDYACARIRSPVLRKEEIPKNSIFDPCRWTDCGGGRCKNTSIFTHECECESDYNNLLNITSFPCFKECVLGEDCAGLDIANRTFFGQNTSFVDRNGSQYVNSSGLKEETMKWWIIIFAAMALILYK